MFFKKLKQNSDEPDMVSMLRSEVNELNKYVRELDHQILKLDGHIKSLRGSFNQFKFRNNPDLEESEDIKTLKPTDVLRGL